MGGMVKWARDWGTHWVGDGARLRRLAGFGALSDVPGWGDDSGMSGSRVRLRERVVVVGGESVEVEGRSAAGGSCFALLTGLRMQRFTWRLRLDATPKRRPQVVQTNAIWSVNGRRNEGPEAHLFRRYERGGAVSVP